MKKHDNREPGEPFAPVVLVTGASRGLGQGVALRMAREGCSVAVNYVRNGEAAAETVRQCLAARRSQNQNFVAIRGDIGDAQQRCALVAQTVGELGRIDALVNNAGIAPKIRADITEAGEESFDELIRTNLKGPCFLTQGVVNYWLKEKPERLLPGGFHLRRL